MKKLFYLFLMYTLISSCSVEKYYLCTVDSPVDVYTSADFGSKILTVNPSQKLIAYNRAGSYRRVSVGQQTGYIRYTSFNSEVQFPKTKLRKFKKLTDTNNGLATKVGTSTSGGAVQVKGYRRKDGTYVKPHTRSAPRRH